MKQLFANNAKTTLQAIFQSTDSVITVVDGSKFPSPGANEFFLLTLVSGVQMEIVTVTSRTGNVLQVGQRSAEGTSLYTFQVGAMAEARITKGTLENLSNTFSEIPSINNVIAPQDSLNNGYICGTLDPAGIPVILIKGTPTTWKFLNYTPIHTGVVSSSTTTSLVTTGLNLSTITVGRYLLEITSGDLSGHIREVSTANTTNLTWITALSATLTAGTTFDIFEANSEILSTASIPDATETVKGKVELATSVETITGIDTSRAVTPKGVFDALVAYGGGGGGGGGGNSISRYTLASDTGGETIITPGWSYVPGTNTLMVYRNGILQTLGTHFTETSTITFTLTSPLEATDVLTVFALITLETLGFLPKTGGTMLGALTLAANAGNPLEPVSKQQMEAYVPSTVTSQVNASMSAHTGASDPHPGYMTSAEDAAIMAAHTAAVDPHPGYMTTAEDAAIMAAHAATVNPHPQYRLLTETGVVAQVLLVGGGGGGGGGSFGSGAIPYGGGGGGGEVVESVLLLDSLKSYTLTIGAGGGISSSSGIGSGTAGSNTTGFGLTARGAQAKPASLDGGNSSFSYISYVGGIGGGFSGGGGAGAGGNGGHSNGAYVQGNGGLGKFSYPFQNFGVGGYFAGGGQGAGTSPTVSTHGGGVVNGNATPNTGGGGGGGYAAPGGAGGSGIILIMYYGPPKFSGGNITTSNGFTFHRVIASTTLTGI